MMPSLLKIRRLRMQLLVGLLLVLGTLPEPSEGLKCYQCADSGKTAASPCSGMKPEKVICPSGADSCYNTKGPTRSTKLCSRNGECVKKAFGSSGCKTATTKAEVDFINRTLHDCKVLLAVVGVAPRMQEDDNGSVSACVCDSDYCNTGSSGGHSPSVIIFAILKLLAFYN